MLLLSSGPDDYIGSTQEEMELVQILCGDDNPVEITISDSDGDFIPPSPRKVSASAARMRLKLKNSHGEYILWSWKKFNQVYLTSFKFVVNNFAMFCSYSRLRGDGGRRALRCIFSYCHSC